MPNRRLVSAIVAGVLTLVPPGMVAAHAELVASTPRPGEVLDAPPDEVALTFDHELDPDGSELSVSDAAGTRVGSGGVDLQVADRNVLRATVEGGAAGTYEVAWTAVAADGHAESGTITFVVAPPERSAPDTAMPAPTLPGLVGVALLCGALVIALGDRRRARRR